jgi:cell division protease FtsH
VTTGSSNDLEKATEMAQQLVRRYGMSDEFGPINLIPPMRNPYDEGQLVYSQKTLEKVDIEVRKIISEAHAEAKKILSQQKDKLEILAQELMEVETLEHDQFKALMEGNYTRKTTAKEEVSTQDAPVQEVTPKESKLSPTSVTKSSKKEPSKS